MLWLKRNLLLVVSGVVALALLGYGGFNLFTSLSKNKQIETEVGEKQELLKRLVNQTPTPDQANITIARENAQRLRQAVSRAEAFFAPVPVRNVSGQDFKILLDNTIDQLRRKAEQLSVGLPSPKYAFSFETQRDKLSLGPGSFPALPTQLAEVAAICNILFDGKINTLANVRRSPVSADDERVRGSMDYHDLKIQTNEMAATVSSPYQFEFHCFSGELAAVMESLWRATNGLCLKSIVVESLEAGPGGAGGPGGPGAPPPAREPPPVLNRPIPPTPPPGARTNYPPRVAGPRRPGPATAPQSQEFKTVLIERPLKVTMLVDVVKRAK